MNIGSEGGGEGGGGAECWATSGNEPERAL